MVEQNRSGTYTQIVYAPTGGKLALMNGQTLSKAFVPVPGGGAAVYNSSGLQYYRHADWLGSSRFASTPTTRAMYSDTAYAPFGETYAAAGTADPSFTGQNQDTVGNLYDFMYREYATQGRWPSPDPAGLAAVDPSNPQSWNRYAYVLGDPLDLVDPIGLHWECVSYIIGGKEGPPDCNWVDDGPGTGVGGGSGPRDGRGGGGNTNGPANNGTQQPSQTSERLQRLKNCALAYYGIDPLSATGLASDASKWLLAGGPGVPKAAAKAVGVRVIAPEGASSFTSLARIGSVLTGGALQPVAVFAKRFGGPIAIASAVIDATAIEICTATD